MVDAMDTDKIASWKDHDPRLRTTNFLLDGQPYSGATHPMRSARGLIHYTGVRHSAESRLLQFSLRPVVIPEDFAFLDRQERVPRDALDGMFERQAVEQDIYNTTGERVAVRTVMRERQSPFNGERTKPRSESSIVTTRLFTSKQQQVLDRVNGNSSADAPSTSDPPPPDVPTASTAASPVSATMDLPASPASATMDIPATPERSGLVANDDPGTPPDQMSQTDTLRFMAAIMQYLNNSPVVPSPTQPTIPRITFVGDNSPPPQGPDPSYIPFESSPVPPQAVEGTARQIQFITADPPFVPYNATFTAPLPPRKQAQRPKVASPASKKPPPKAADLSQQKLPMMFQASKIAKTKITSPGEAGPVYTRP